MSKEPITEPDYPRTAAYAGWERQIEPCRARIYAGFVRRGFLHQEAEDLTQETMLRAWR